MDKHMILISAVVTFIFNMSFAQQEPMQEINRYFAEARSGRGYLVTIDILEKTEPAVVVENVRSQLSSASPRVRYAALEIASRRAQLLPPGKERYPFVMILSEAVSDTDRFVNSIALRGLRNMSHADFSKESRKIISQQLQIPTLRHDELIKIAGFAGCRKSMPYLRQAYIENPATPEKVKWAANLAMARMGDEECLAYCLEKVKSKPVNDILVSDYFPDLVYTRCESAMEYMLNEILCQDTKCLSFNPDTNTTIICAWKIMELIAPVIRNFPFPVVDGYFPTGDYNEALATVRGWINNGAGVEVEREYY